jgi:E3 ubiquitin-protein ligase DOA10
MKHNLIEKTKISVGAVKLREIVDEAVKTGFISHDDYDKIINIVSEDGHIDNHEQAILTEFHQMIHDKDIKFKTK